MGQYLPDGNPADFKRPRYCIAELAPHGLRDWSRSQLLTACARLRIPVERWPVFADPLDVPARLDSIPSFPSFSPPLFDILYESPGEWRDKAIAAFREYCDYLVRATEEALKVMIEKGSLVKIPVPKEKNSTLALRYEWAARRYCFNDPYKAISSDEHSPEKIRKAVRKIFTEAAVPKRT